MTEFFTKSKRSLSKIWNNWEQQFSSVLIFFSSFFFSHKFSFFFLSRQTTQQLNWQRMTEFLFSSSQQNQPQKVSFCWEDLIISTWFWKTQHKKRDVSFCLLNFSEYFGISVIIVVIMLNMMCSMMQLEKLLNTMKFFLDFFSWIFFFLRSWIFFLILIFLNLLLVCRGKKANFSFFWRFWLLFGQLWDDSY